MTEIEFSDIDIDDKIKYCIDTILKEAKKEDRMVKQAFFGMLSAYTCNPLNIKAESPSGEGKNYVLGKVAEIFPKQDVIQLAGITDKALFHRAGKLVIKNNANGEYEDAEGLIEEYNSRIESLKSELESCKNKDKKDGLKAQIKAVEEEKRDLENSTIKLIDVSHKILMVLDTVKPGLLNTLMSILSHDNYETEYEYADSTNNGIKTKVNVIRGFPAFFYAQALDISHYKRYPEIKRRFLKITPKMTKEKYRAAIELIGKKFGLPDFMYQEVVVSNAEKVKAREIVHRFKDNILNVCSAIEPGNNNVIVPFQKNVLDALKADDAQDMTVTYRLFSWLSLLPIVKIEKRPRLIIRKKGEVIRQVIPFALFEDLKEAIFLMEYTGGPRPHMSEWLKYVFLETFNTKTEPDSKTLASGEIKKEDKIAVTNEQLIKATKEIQGKTLTSQQILQIYLYPLMNEGYIDRQVSNIHGKGYIYFPTGLESGSNNDGNRSFLRFLDRKMNEERATGNQQLADFTHEFDAEYIKAEIEKVVVHSSNTCIFCEIFDHENKKITVDELIERYYFPSKPDPDPSGSTDGPSDSGSGSDTDSDRGTVVENKENCEKSGVLEEQAIEVKSSSVGQTEPILIHSDSNIAENE
jgi:hypothetical protein